MLKKTTKQLYIRGQILNELYLRGPISRVDIAHNTSITPATTTEVTAKLLAERLISNAPLSAAIKSQTGSGRKKILLTITNHHSHYIGMELSRSFLSFCLTTNTGEIIDTEYISQFPTSQYNIISSAFVTQQLLRFINKHKQLNVQAIGIALPGHFKSEEKSIASVSEWQHFDIASIIEAVPLPIYLENNVHCMSLYEHLMTNKNKGQNFIFFHAVHGIFSSSIYQEDLYGKRNFSVGEIGHTIIQPDGPLCECGRKGCLQTYVGGFHIIAKARRIFENSDNTFLRSLVSSSEEITFDTVLEAYHLGDIAMIRIIKEAMQAVSVTINNLTMLIDAPKIYLHGPIFNNDITSLLLEEYIHHKNLYGKSNEINFEIVPYHELNGARGAATLAIHHYLIWSHR
ncbi:MULTISPECIES: ROK family protein [Staphylococcus]|uniref:ROK family protein n=1 Tax=Staphylococcus TaxID=1279 RepID=UPI000D1A14DD|nr:MULTISPECIES: ROK family protein [Staphylococcus]MCD8907403.1 ROK family protein [Staphylococcus arlettae]PTH24526.1 ROK family protein [Staphylococcus arlettae]PTH30841.1 ROK family protein [Staphylococcus arlettae]PTH34480.1 ROK family protein [Staphylococcus arlettae]PTH48235.1 ROK family protein [Staphylococcus arlettae]